MRNSVKELTPVEYSAAAIKVLHLEIQPLCPCFRTHWHDRLEILRIKQGQMQIEFATDSATLCKGDVIILPPKMPHKAIAGKSGVVYDVLMFDIRSFYNETQVCQSTLPAIFDGRARLSNITTDAEIVCCVDSICSDSEQGTLLTTARVYTLLDCILKKCLLSMSREANDSAAKKIIDYIEENFSHELTTATLCSEFGYSAAHFCRKFREATSLSPMTYLKIYRLERARDKIKGGEKNIGQVAAECGFSDANYFTRCFKAHFGVSPTHYKKGK